MASAFCLLACVHAPCVGVDTGLWEVQGNLVPSPLLPGCLPHTALLGPVALALG